ncbi:MAG: phosphonate ABC transporter, permease protein PhnE [Anaerorhabdus sp.]
MRNIKLFDQVFKPEVVELSNGKTVTRPRSRLPLILLATGLVIVWALWFTQFDGAIIIKRIGNMGSILGKIFNPNFSYFPDILPALIDTIKMSLLGTIIGVGAGLPVAVLASNNINPVKPVVLICRFVLGIVRTVPTLVMATIFALVFGLGTFAGTISLAIFTFGIISKMMFESIETIDMGAFQALESVGCSRLRAFWVACMPQILPIYLSHSLYCFETNVRAAAILGYVGAGGLGILINERIGWRAYNDLGMILLTLFVTLLVIDQLNTFIRRKLV